MSHDDLIERIRRRAWDPARRHDEVFVPLDWLKSEYGESVTSRISSYRMRQLSDEGDSMTGLYWGSEPQDHLMDAALESGASEAVKYFSNTPHEPPCPPISHADLLACEERIGHKLPELLRRVYTEVSNGGFGPAYDLLHLPSKEHSVPREHQDALTLFEEDPDLSKVLGFPLVGAGCSMYWYVSLTQPGNPVCLWDGDAWDFPEEQSPEVGIVITAPSLAEWFDGWANGYDWYSHPPIPRKQPQQVYPKDVPLSSPGDDPWFITLPGEPG
ncbi:SMI1/KNR4 family protein [Nonomuraea jiangxiensis]|uniref:Knr4/Smi1-like domain-containing protein n=1 Tax=Nonomuraea jiangxiensis TaxID=633440 RepID=A0A1G9TUY6_9ACTN|nr:SMI1/KNR4 family protein [Nonomuraea jiangxiensis]SDM51045.1 hypothetical protein SAMN05421869_1464 [Nonomuraea jiangxiensis]